MTTTGPSRRRRTPKPEPSHYASFRLSTEATWEELERLLDPGDASARAKLIVRRLRESGAKSAIVEIDYRDGDFSAEYQAFYAKLFHRYERGTKRFHFFREDLSGLMGKKPSEIVKRLRKVEAKGAYLGFIVCRPVNDAPIGRAVLDLAERVEEDKEEAGLQVRARHEAHLFGITLSVTALPFTEQDRRISSCAQATLWVCARHFQARHGSPWLSIVSVSDAATSPLDINSAQALPAGTMGLHPDNLTRALKAMGRQPYAFHRSPTNEDAPWQKDVRAEAIIARYVDSGIPVILGLRPTSDRDGHAVVACGMVRTVSKSLRRLARGEKRTVDASHFISHFLVHDDQRGPSIRMPVKSPNSRPLTKRTLADVDLEKDLFFILVPLPDKVFVTAESAELRAWDLLGNYVKSWEEVLKAVEIQDDVVEAAKAVTAANQRKTIVARTYLTLGWKYKRWILDASPSEALRSHIMLQPLPRMVWVTEFGHFDELNKIDPRERRIFGHCVVDATTMGSKHPPIVLHAPGLLTVWSQANGSHSEPQPDFRPVPDDAPFPVRTRRSALTPA